ncbi:hypothetical protein RclHR1_07650004 [Rhizophagus clarus]|uniref:Uncharacterized protein n=1 Tax=Rhizophagus clarus TaxID=94130 RepID=A0A2Z6SLF8_9GLOM|nr:hypothetical protein RclHR1_07650004 [Rhizophagus clarus]
MKAKQVTSTTTHLVGVVANRPGRPSLWPKSINDLEQVIQDGRPRGRQTRNGERYHLEFRERFWKKPNLNHNDNGHNSGSESATSGSGSGSKLATSGSRSGLDI